MLEAAAALPLFLKVLALALGLALIAAPVIIPVVRQHLSEGQRVRLLAAVKSAVLVVGEVAPATPTTLDDQLVKVLRAVEEELGRPLKKKEVPVAKSMAKALNADPRFPARLTPPPKL